MEMVFSFLTRNVKSSNKVTRKNKFFNTVETGTAKSYSSASVLDKFSR